MQKQVDELLSTNPLYINDPSFRREYLGEWVIEDNARVYKSDHNNYINVIPEGFLKSASYILSVDIGFNDPTSFIVSAFNKNYNGNMYVLESEKYKKYMEKDGGNDPNKYEVGTIFTLIN